MKILLVEDEINIASFIERGLQEFGHEVRVANDGQAGWELVQQEDFQLLILDIIMPKMNGLQLCKQYRQTYGYQSPVIMLTALGTTDDIVNGLDAGADDYLIKPFALSELTARIEAVLRRAQGGGFGDAWAHDIEGKQIRLHLHQIIALARAAIHTQLRGGLAGIGFHRLYNVIHLKCNAFKHGAGEVAVGRAAGDAEKSAACVLIPIRRTHARECGHEIHAAVVGHGSGQRVDFIGFAYQPRAVAQPLDCRAAHKHAAFERISGFAANFPGHGGEQIVL